jgi:hypothetical protein
MRVGENLSSFWQNIAAMLWIAGLGLCFVAAVSTLWGWYVVGVVSCLALLAIVFEDRRAIRRAIQGQTVRLADRAFAWYLLVLAGGAIVANSAAGIAWLAGHRA